MKGIVAEVRGNRAIILTQHGEFVEICNKGYTVGHQITYVQPSYKKYITIAACFILCLLVGFSGYSVYSKPVSFVSMDINPSFRFDVNRFNQVIKINALNDEATALLSALNLGSKDVGEVVKQVLLKAEEMGYINEENNKVEINVTGDSEKVIEKVEKVTQPYVNQQVEVIVEQAGIEEANQAKDMNISVGKLKAVQEYTSVYGGTVEENANKLKNIPNGKIRKEVKEAVKSKVELKSEDESEVKNNGRNSSQDKRSIQETRKNNKEINTNDNGEKTFKQQPKGNVKNTEKSEKSYKEPKVKNDAKNSGKDKNTVREKNKNNNENANGNGSKAFKQQPKTNVKDAEKSDNSRIENQKGNPRKFDDKDNKGNGNRKDKDKR